MDGNVMNALIKVTLVAWLGCVSVSAADDGFELTFAVVLQDNRITTIDNAEATSAVSDSTSVSDTSYDATMSSMTNTEKITITTSGSANEECGPMCGNINGDNVETLEFLCCVYYNETGHLGFLDVNWTSSSNGLEQCYNVTYNWTVLKPQFSELVPALERSQQAIEDYGDCCNIDTIATAELGINNVENITEAAACAAYEKEERCEDGFFSRGVCMYDGINAYCSCDSWGLIDEDFVSSDGKCINVDVIVAITVGGVSLILLILLITICCLSCNIAKLEDEVENLKESHDDEYLFSDPPKEQTVQNPAYEKNWQNPVLMPDVQAADTLDSSTDDAHPQLNGYHKYGAKKRDSDLYMPEPHEMGAYNKSYLPEPGAPWESTVSNSQDMTESEAYKNFKASLDHIDPNANYNIRRPNLSIRPTNGMYEVPKRSDVPSFRI